VLAGSRERTGCEGARPSAVPVCLRPCRDDALSDAVQAAVAGARTRTKAVTVAVPAMWPGAAMSRGLGVWQRRLLAALEERPTVSLVDVLPRPYARSQYVALHRAAWSLRGKGKVDIHHAQRKGHMWVCRLQSD
jgi:hypothetical protein